MGWDGMGGGEEVRRGEGRKGGREGGEGRDARWSEVPESGEEGWMDGERMVGVLRSMESGIVGEDGVVSKG